MHTVTKTVLFTNTRNNYLWNVFFEQEHCFVDVTGPIFLFRLLTSTCTISQITISIPLLSLTKVANRNSFNSESFSVLLGNPEDLKITHGDRYCFSYVTRAYRSSVRFSWSPTSTWNNIFSHVLNLQVSDDRKQWKVAIQIKLSLFVAFTCARLEKKEPWTCWYTKILTNCEINYAVKYH